MNDNCVRNMYKNEIAYVCIYQHHVKKKVKLICICIILKVGKVFFFSSFEKN